MGTESREVRDQLKALSMEIFGVSSRYQKLYQYDHLLTTMVKETVPGENGAPDTEIEKEVPLLVAGTKVKQSVRKNRSTEEVLQLLLDFKAKREEFLAKMNEQKAEAAAKAKADQAAAKLQEELNGSAL